MIKEQKLSNILSHGRVLWDVEVGRFHYRNNIVAVDELLFVSTSGAERNVADDRDGVVCLHKTEGQQVWRFNSVGDPNSVIYKDRKVLGGTDQGQLFALNSESGDISAEYRCQAPVAAKPVLIEESGRDLAVFIAVSGEIIGYDFSSSSFSMMGKIDGVFTSDPATSEDLIRQSTFFVASDNGFIYRAKIVGNEVDATHLSTLVGGRSDWGPSGIVVRGISTLVIHEDKLIVSYERDTTYANPPISCFDIQSGIEIWRAKPVKTLSKRHIDYGNGRVSPVIFGREVITTFAYTDSVYSFSLDSGRGLWRAKLDRGFFQNWASPSLDISNGARFLYVPRVNGVLHKVDLRKKKLVDSLSVEVGRYQTNDHPDTLGDQEGWWEGTHPIGEEMIGGDGKPPYPRDELEAGLAATPLILDDMIIVGGVSGRLRAFRK